MSPAAGPVAAIDLGTNTALLLVARRDASGRLEVIEEVCRTPRLGAGLAVGGHLDPAAIARAAAVLHDFARRIEHHGVPARRVRAVGTAVLRRASDASAFTERIGRECGLEVEVLPGDEEARLGALAIAQAGAEPDVVVLDVGGGSTEVACAALGLRASAPLGAVLLTEGWAGAGADPTTSWIRVKAEAEHGLRVLPAGCARGRPCWAIGGTAVNLACLARELPRFDPTRAEGVVVSVRSAHQFADQLAGLDVAARRRLPIEAERADILPAGLALLSAALDRIGASEVRICGRGLRHGVAWELLEGGAP